MSGQFSQTLEGGPGIGVFGGGNSNDWISGGDGDNTIAGFAGRGHGAQRRSSRHLAVPAPL